MINSILLENTGKRFSREWIFRALSFEFKVGKPIAITGSNGSGKSTLVKAIAGAFPINEGEIKYFQNTEILDEAHWHKYLGISAPYLELIEEFTLSEIIDFHIKFRPFNSGIDKKIFLENLGLEKHLQKHVRDFSSGMKQKLKLGFAFYTQNEILILDEPTANIDQQGFEWYLEEVQKQISSKFVIISSNEPKEYSFCNEAISILDYKF